MRAPSNSTVMKTRAILVIRGSDERSLAAAKAAGLFCVAVPNQLTSQLDLSAADVVVPSLAELPLTELAQRLAG